MTQHRLSRVQVINWGTFDGAWGFDVPWKGMLLTGPSGAGKSSLLDAMACVLVRPAKLRFNAAAQGTDTGDRDRTLLTYVRGAHKRETDESTGEVGTAFLRKGPTWSGVLLTFCDAAGKEVSLLRLFHISGSSTQAADVKSMYAIAPGPFDLVQLQPYVANGLEHRRMKRELPGWDIYTADRYSAFSERFRRMLGMGSEQAQVLLHKTQSAKNLTNLDNLFRDFMLDVPDTFELSDTTVAQFGELRSAHNFVVDARLQVEKLMPLRAHDERLRSLEAEQRELSAQEEHLETWLTARRLELKEHELGRAEPVLTRLAAEVGGATAEDASNEAERQRCQRAVDQSGGAEITTLQQLATSERRRRDQIMATRSRHAEAATQLAIQLPDHAADVAGFSRALEEVGEALQRDRAAFGRSQFDLMGEKTRAGDDRRRRAEDLDALRRHRSNLDPRLLELRSRLADLLQVEVSALPFVGELVEVRPEEHEWVGAIERVLGSFGRTLLVPDEHYLAAAEFVDATFLGTRLVYEKVTRGASRPPEAAAPPEALPSKVQLAEGPFTGWVAERLARRYNFACVATPAQFARHDRAVTRNGQVKHSASLHEKDDRRGVGDRSRWVLGFSIDTKERELERLLALEDARLEEVEKQLASLDEVRRRLTMTERAAETLSGFSWEQLDLAPVEAALADVERQLAALRDTHHDLAALEQSLRRAEVDKSDSARRLTDLQATHRHHADVVERLRRDIASLRESFDAADPIPEAIADALARHAEESTASLEQLPGRLNALFRKRSEEVANAIGRSVRAAERVMADYGRSWEAAAADWGDTREYLPEYLARLDVLVEDRLPEFETRFFELLQRQARNNIGQLAMRIRAARGETRGRVDGVNKSLRLTPFGPDAYLQIKVLDRSLPDVDRFLRTLGDITEGSMLDIGAGDSAEDRRLAEERFSTMEDLLQRLGSADPAARAWRERCLDTRQHVSFQARVIDDEGRQLDVFTGSGGRSGGERQKLVTFCLAAALRFQLAPEGQTEPTYALVVIDEAFDKADHTFTAAGLEVFRAFGFQLLLATPMKMLQTIDDYVGGVVMVTHVPGRGSTLQEMHYDRARPTTSVAVDQETLV